MGLRWNKKLLKILFYSHSTKQKIINLMLELSDAAQIVLFCSHNIYINETNDLKMISNGWRGVPNILHMQKNIIRAIEEMAPDFVSKEN